MVRASEQLDRRRKLLAEIFYEDEVFLDELTRDLDKDEEKLLTRVADFGLDLLARMANSGDAESLAALIREKNGFNDALRRFKKSRHSR